MEFKNLKPALPVGKFYLVDVIMQSHSYSVKGAKSIDIGSTHLLLNFPPERTRMIELAGADIDISVVEV